MQVWVLRLLLEQQGLGMKISASSFRAYLKDAQRGADVGVYLLGAALGTVCHAVALHIWHYAGSNHVTLYSCMHPLMCTWFYTSGSRPIAA